MNRFMLRSLCLLALASCAFSARATLIDFNNAPLGPLSTYYSPLGVTLKNATVELGAGDSTGNVPPIGIRATSGSGGAIEALFADEQQSVTLTALNTSSSGYILRAFDADDRLVDAKLTGIFGPNGPGRYTLTVNGHIRRVEFLSSGSYDNLLFTPAPGPMAALPFALMAIKRRRKA